MSFATLMREARRLNILQCLSAAPGMSLNAGILHGALNSAGIQASHDQVTADVAWLAELGLVQVERLPSGAASITVATLTPAGDDAAHGRSHVPGVQRPLAGGNPWEA